MAELSISADTVMTDIAADSRSRAQLPGARRGRGGRWARSRSATGPRSPGNICNASPAADTAPRAAGLRRAVVAFGPGGTRRIPIEAFFTAPGPDHAGPRRARHRDRAPGAGRAGRVRVRPADPAAGRGPGYGQRVRVRRRLGRDPARPRRGRPASAAGRRRHRRAGRPGRRPGRAGGRCWPGLLPTASPISDVRASREYRLSMLARAEPAGAPRGTGPAGGGVRLMSADNADPADRQRSAPRRSDVAPQRTLLDAAAR